MSSRRWLVKTEPSTYSFDDLVREGTTRWEGVKNPQALIHLRAMAEGDDVLVYHTGKEKAGVGLARVARGPYADPKAKDDRLVAVDLAAVAPLAHAVPLARLRERADLARWDLLTNSRLSVMPVPDAAWKAVRALGRSAP
jgi:predicted RNA-binding protein with PUA-like domain